MRTLWRVPWYFLPGLPSPTRSQGLGLGDSTVSGEGFRVVGEEARDEKRGMLLRGGERAHEHGTRRAAEKEGNNIL